MANQTTTFVDTGYTVMESGSFDISFRFITDDGNATATAPSSAKVYVYLDGSTTFINGRDGSDSTGLTVTDTNLVSFHMYPADNVLVSSANRYETHKVLIDVFYNADADLYRREYSIKVLNNSAV